MVAVLASVIVGGGIVYGAMPYLERNPLQVDIVVRSTTPTPTPASGH